MYGSKKLVEKRKKKYLRTFVQSIMWSSSAADYALYTLSVPLTCLVRSWSIFAFVKRKKIRTSSVRHAGTAASFPPQVYILFLRFDFLYFDTFIIPPPPFFLKNRHSTELKMWWMGEEAERKGCWCIKLAEPCFFAHPSLNWLKFGYRESGCCCLFVFRFFQCP